MTEEFDPQREEGSSLSEKNQKIQDKIKNLYANIPKDKKGKFRAEINSRAIYLQNKYPDHGKREVFHVISSSSIMPGLGELIKDDFPGEDSVEAFIDALEEKYKI